MIEPVVCPNCESKHVEEYCAACGQKRPDPRADYSLWSVLGAAAQRVTQYDGRLLRSLRALFVHPGLLARDHFDGRRGRHVPPFELFVLANLAAWLAVPYLHIYGFSMAGVMKYAIFREHWPAAFAWREAMSGRSHEFFVQQADAASASVNKLTLLCLVPIFAVATKLVITGRPYRFVQCLIFGVHFYCIHMATILAGWGLVLIPIVRWFIAHPDATWGHPLVVLWKSNWFAHFSVAPVLLPYLYVALQRAFDLDKRAAGWRALVLTLASCTLLRAFFDVGAVIMMIAA